MSKPMPQEIEVWYLLPALRRELAKVFISEHKLSQKEAANLLDITESAISQYVKHKRGDEIKFTNEESQEIRKTAEMILKEKDNLTKHLYDLSVYFRGSKVICELHRKHDGSLDSKCKICMEE